MAPVINKVSSRCFYFYFCCFEFCFISFRSETDLNRHWEVSSPSLSPPPGHRHLAASKPRYNSHQALQHNLSIEDAFDRAMSLPSSPTVKNAQNNFESYEEDLVKKPRSSSEKTKKEQRERFTASPSSSLGLGRKTFLDGLKIKSRTKSGDNLTCPADRPDLRPDLDHNGSLSEEKFPLPAGRRFSESAKQVCYDLCNTEAVIVLLSVLGVGPPSSPCLLHLRSLFNYSQSWGRAGCSQQGPWPAY